MGRTWATFSLPRYHLALLAPPHHLPHLLVIVHTAMIGGVAAVADASAAECESAEAANCYEYQREFGAAGAAGWERRRGGIGAVRARRLRSSGVTVWRDVFHRSGAVICQFAQGDAAGGTACIRLLA